MNIKFFISLFFLVVYSSISTAQFTKADSLRGMLRPERTCYDVLFYDLTVEVFPKKRTIQGKNIITYKTTRGFNMLQLDLFNNMKIDSIIHNGNELKYYRQHDAFFVDFGEMQEEEQIQELTIYYQGRPTEAVNPPWDGGFTWVKDELGNPWIGVSCEGIGASLWWPNKDHLSDEPDSMRITTIVPEKLTCISNGIQRNGEIKDGKHIQEWFVSYPINNYNVTLNIGQYVHFSDTFVSPTDGTKLPLDYYVMPYNLEKAKEHFKQVHPILEVFEKRLDKYPFWNDGYALVETPYAGMEHQGAIAYGNRYMDGYWGRHPRGVSEDFIILHETGHEWWGNSVSCHDLAEMWLHETFTTYMEAVYVEDIYGYDKAVDYLVYHHDYIANYEPIIGPKDVNYKDHDTDIYYKGSAMLHTLRTMINDDEKWWAILQDFYQRNKIGHARTEDFVKVVEDYTGEDYPQFFEQYLYHTDVPVLQCKVNTKKNKVQVELLWEADVDGFSMPVWIRSQKDEEFIWVDDKEWTKIELTKGSSDRIRFDYGLFDLEWYD